MRRLNGGRHRQVLFTDEKVFTIEEVVNKQNDRIYARSNPHLTVPRSAHPKSIMVFAGICYDGKTPLIFVPQGVKVNVTNYLDLLKTHVLPWSKQHFGRKKWIYQQDGAPAHKAKTVQDFCKSNFPDFISYNEWLPNSPDCNPMDYSVWSVLEAKACSKNHSSIESLKKILGGSLE